MAINALSIEFNVLTLNHTIGWMNDLRFYVLFNNSSSYQDDERLIMKL